MSIIDRSKLLIELVKLYKEAGLSEESTMIELVYFDRSYTKKFSQRNDRYERYSGIVRYVYNES